MFNILKNYHTIPDWSRIKGNLVDGYPNFNIYSIKDTEYLNEFFKPLFSYTIAPCMINCIEITDNVDPHIDNYPFTSVVNFVVESADATTTFYKKRNSSDYVFENEVIVGNKTNEPIKRYSIDERLEVLGSVKTQNGDFIQYDVSKIHGIKIDNTTSRKFITWRWVHISYENLSKHIKILF